MPTLEEPPVSHFTTVYVKKTGEKTRVPTAWLEHPKLGAPFTKTPPKQGGKQAAPAVTDKKKETPAKPEKGA